ncbi:MAG TPA: hypothetical protein PLV93_13535 [Microthrixaceae bacterium]|nr:hypothetical protein [Microthrixaceae bacterium]HNI36419.1 hypothetical protein [Microthrixaceae bacterium]
MRFYDADLNGGEQKADMDPIALNDGENLVPLLVMSGGLVVTALWSIREHLIPRQLDLPRRSSSRTAAVTS